MRYLLWLLALAGVAVAGPYFFRRPATEPLSSRSARDADVRMEQDATQRSLRLAERYIALYPTRPEGYARRAAALIQLGRETGDFGRYAQAEADARRALELSPDRPDAHLLQARILVAYHRFEEALTPAQRALTLRADSPDAYGVLTDAYVELGRYDAALDAAQRMMNLRPDGESYARTAHLRWLHGDVEGAVEAMEVAIRATDARHREARAWMHAQLGKILHTAGALGAAEQAFNAALDIFPNYHLALFEKGVGRILQNDLPGALPLLQAAFDKVPTAETALALGDCLHALGRDAEAQKQYELAEFIESRGGAGPTGLLARAWADQGVRLDEALRIAQAERQKRQDVLTCDTLAWCLCRNGRLDEAEQAIREARRLGAPDARILFHAAVIALKQGRRAEARRDFARAVACGLGAYPRYVELGRTLFPPAE